MGVMVLFFIITLPWKWLTIEALLLVGWVVVWFIQGLTYERWYSGQYGLGPKQFWLITTGGGAVGLGTGNVILLLFFWTKEFLHCLWKCLQYL